MTLEHHDNASDEWLTPRVILDRVLKIFDGRIDLDPCAELAEPKNVPARRHYTVRDDGLLLPWQDHVFANVPFSRGLLESFVRKAVREHLYWHARIILLTPARPGSEWWRALSDYPVCLTWGRVRYRGRVDGSPNFGTAVWALGVDVDRFAAAFGDLGEIRIPYRRAAVLACG